MAYQAASKILVALKAETTTGVAVGTVTGATRMRIIDSPGLKLNRAQVASAEKRSDGLRPMGRLGYKSVDGQHNAEATTGGATDRLLEAIMRSMWVTANAIPFSDVSGITCGTNFVAGQAGDWVGSEGIRVGDVFRLSGHGTTANNDENLRVTAVTSETISVPAGSLTVDATVDSTGTLTVLRKLATASTPTERTFNVEQYDQDIDQSELFLGCKLVGFNLSCRPGEMAQIQYRWIGIDRETKTTGQSPFFTTPSLTTGLAMVADDSLILQDGVAITTFTGFDLSFSLAAAGEPVIGSLTTPDIFSNDTTVEGTITGLRENLDYLDAYDAETEYEISILLEEATTDPKPCLGVYLPRVKISAIDAPVGGGDGAKIETRTLMVGPKASGVTGYDAGIAVFHTSETES